MDKVEELGTARFGVGKAGRLKDSRMASGSFSHSGSGCQLYGAQKEGIQMFPSGESPLTINKPVFIMILKESGTKAV